MKHSTLVLGMVIGGGVDAIYHPTSDIYYHEKVDRTIPFSMWSFGSTSGVNIWNVDGSHLFREHLPSDLPMCGTNSDGLPQCHFFAYDSDGHAHVWVGAFGPDRVDVFDIDTGDYVSYIPTCSTPMDLSYHPHREEMWLHCAGTNDNGDGHIDSFSTNSLSANFEQINLNVTGRSYGHQVVDSSLGIFAYSTVYNQPFVYKLDLATREIHSKIPLDLAYGAYDIAFSKVNGHIFVRTRVTCTCGPGKDVPECGRFGSQVVDILTGPSAGQKQVNGTASSSCEGSAADTIGVYEIDTKTDTIVASHNILKGTGFGASPVATPDGKYIMLLGNDGGKNVRVLLPGRNGQPSTLLADIPVNFANSLPGTIAVTDFAIAEIGGRNVAVFASGSDNDVAIVDLESPTSVPKISLTSSSFASGVAGEGRSVEWAQGTEFVWLTGQEAKEIYVIQIPRGDIGRATVKTVIQGVDASALMYVENYAARAVATSLERSSRFHEAVAANQDNTLSVVSLVIACLAFVFSVALFFRVVMTRSTNKVATNGPEKTDRGSLDLAFDHLEQQAADAKSLGSKQVM